MKTEQKQQEKLIFKIVKDLGKLEDFASNKINHVKTNDKVRWAIRDAKHDVYSAYNSFVKSNKKTK